jgi:hypothetical protein
MRSFRYWTRSLLLMRKSSKWTTLINWGWSVFIHLNWSPFHIRSRVWVLLISKVHRLCWWTLILVIARQRSLFSWWSSIMSTRFLLNTWWDASYLTLWMCLLIKKSLVNWILLAIDVCDLLLTTNSWLERILLSQMMMSLIFIHDVF